MAGKLDSLEVLFNRQRFLMDLLGILTEGVEFPREQLISSAIGMAVEAGEALDEMNKSSRPWKKEEDVKEHVIEETVDVLFYTLETLILAGVGPDQLKMLYFKKFIYNISRLFVPLSVEERKWAIGVGKGLLSEEWAEARFVTAVQVLSAAGVVDLGTQEFTDNDYCFITDPTLHTSRILKEMEYHD